MICLSYCYFSCQFILVRHYSGGWVELLAVCSLLRLAVRVSFRHSCQCINLLPPRLVGLGLVQINSWFWQNSDSGKASMCAFETTMRIYNYMGGNYNLCGIVQDRHCPSNCSITVRRSGRRVLAISWISVDFSAIKCFLCF